MARFCSACGRPLDKRGHRIVRRAHPLAKRGQVLRVPNVTGYGAKTRRIYICRVIPAYDSPTSGKTLARGPYRQRIKAANIRHVQEDRVA